MDSQSFDALLESTKEAREILAKKKNPSRTFYIEEPNPKEIRAKFHLTAEIRCRVCGTEVPAP